jgi:hypothetical protein
MRRRHVVVGIGIVALAAASSLSLDAQLPLATPKVSGQAVSPVFEGWYANADGTFSLSFGYFNRNAEEVIEIPVGPNNFVGPGQQNQGQPTSFQARRHWGVFAVKVPANFGLKEVVWTLKFRGTTYAIPGTLHPNWQIDALEGEAGSGNTPPVVKIGDPASEARGPAGSMAGPLRATVGQPLTIDIWASDDGRSPATQPATPSAAPPQTPPVPPPAAGAARTGRAGRGPTPPTVALAYFKHQGPGAITFTPSSGRAAAAGARATTSAVFSEAGDYIVRVRANDSSGVANAGHAQCCWTNAFVKVTVTR